MAQHARISVSSSSIPGKQLVQSNEHRRKRGANGSLEHGTSDQFWMLNVPCVHVCSDSEVCMPRVAFGCVCECDQYFQL